MSNQLVITSGAKVRSLNGVITGTTGVLDSLPINGANGIPQLDSSGKILVSQLPNSVMEYKGTWNAATNTPTLADGTGNQGDVYLCNVAGTVNFGSGPIAFVVGDQVIYSGTIWQRASGATGTVTSVAVTESGDALSITGSPITTSGTINIGFAGSSTQYIAGDGSLVTFPTIVTEAQNLITDVYNETGATLTKGTVVYINGGHGNLPTVTKALATSDATSAQTYGVVQTNIGNNNNGHVVVIGRLENLDTQAYSNGTQLYLSSTTAGAWTSTKQYAPNHLVYVGIVTRSHPTQGVVEVKIQNGYELDELHNVSAQSPTNNDGLFYNSSNSLWENKSIATALGYTPANAALVVPYTGATGNVTLGAYKLTATNLEVLGATASIKATDTGASLGIGVAANSGAISIASNGNVYLNSDVYLDPGYIGSGGGMLKYTSIGKLTKAVAGTDYVAPSALSGYLPLTGGTLTGALGGTSATFSGNVGIGNTASSPLDVTADNSTAINLRLRGRAADSVGQMEFWNNAQSTRYGYIATDSTAMSMVTTQAIPLILGSNSTARLTIASTGAATFSSSVTANRFIVNGTNGNSGQIIQQGDLLGTAATNLLFQSSTGNSIGFLTNGGTTFNMFINTSGNVGIGTSSPSYKLSLVGPNGGTAMSWTDNVNNTGYLSIRSAAAAIGADNNLVFETAASERARITSGGQLQIKQAGNTFNDGLRLINTSSVYWGFVAGGDTNLYLGYNSTSASIGVFNSSTGAYTATSDINKKKDFEQSTIGLDAILGLKPTLYRMKNEEENTKKHLGFIAQEVKDFIPQAYSENKNGDNIFIGLTEMPIIAALVKAIQELSQEVDELKGKLA